MDTEKQRQRRRNDARLTESGNARSDQLNTCGAYRVANQQSLACLSGSEHRRRGWFLDMNLFDESSVKIFTAQGQRGGVNFRPLQEIKAKYGDGRRFNTGTLFARLRQLHMHRKLHPNEAIVRERVAISTL